VPYRQFDIDGAFCMQSGKIFDITLAGWFKIHGSGFRAPTVVGSIKPNDAVKMDI
jgi:hypothetical protein